MAKKHERTDKSDTEIDTEGGGEAGLSPEEAIVDFVKATRIGTTRLLNILRTKQGRHVFRRDLLSVKVCKTWFDFQRTHCSKLTQSKSGQASKEITERQNWI